MENSRSDSYRSIAQAGKGAMLGIVPLYEPTKAEDVTAEYGSPYRSMSSANISL